MWETKIVWFLSAFLASLAGGLASHGTEAFPGLYATVIIVIGAAAAGMVAWRAFVKKPPE